MAWLTGMVAFAEAAIQGQDKYSAKQLFDRLVPFAGLLQCEGATSLGPVSYFLGGLATVLGLFDQADTYFTQATEFCDRVGAKFFAARTDLAWGRMLVNAAIPTISIGRGKMLSQGASRRSRPRVWNC